jgi:hypothetical protein
MSRGGGGATLGRNCYINIGGVHDGHAVQRGCSSEFLRFQSVSQTKHDTSPVQRSAG